MSLLNEKWIPVRCRDGSSCRIAPDELSRPDLARFDAPRADFNGALAQLFIGVLQTTSPVNNPIEWRGLFNKPPDADTLQTWFNPMAAALEYEGNGARFMQDFDLRASDGDPVGIGNLLIESPGENTIKNNGDLFIKRGNVQALCPHCAVLALFTLQVNAPAGGAGHRTGLRGGGPLTTLLLAQSDPGTPRSLWHDLWLNVQDRRYFYAGGGDPEHTAPHLSFPWLAGIDATQKVGGQTTPVQTHPAHVFWAMPRRIRLDMDTLGQGPCDLCGCESLRLVRQYVTRNYGLNYKEGWKHPLTPYYDSKGSLLPLHPQPGGLGYRHWLGWVLGVETEKRKVERAAVVSHFFAAKAEQLQGVGLRMWAFGYDMDNMKARSWYETTVPLYALGECSPSEQRAVREEVSTWLASAELGTSYLRGAVKEAWFGGDARGDFSFVDASFWSRSEMAFHASLRARIHSARDAGSWNRIAHAESWQQVLYNVALDLFDNQYVGAGPVERQNPARVADAYRRLRANLHGPKLRDALGLPATPKDKFKPGRKAAEQA